MSVSLINWTARLMASGRPKQQKITDLKPGNRVAIRSSHSVEEGPRPTCP